ncbi:MAG: hypothetical protein ACRDL7_13350, partial [Gaiellaceae bacterium]
MRDGSWLHTNGWSVDVISAALKIHTRAVVCVWLVSAHPVIVDPSETSASVTTVLSARVDGRVLAAHAR